MVCKEDVIQWFKDSHSYRRIEVMCALFNMCIPFEVRFLGTFIEGQGKHDYQELRGAAITANDLDKLAKQFPSSKGILDSCTRGRVTLYVSLLQSLNYACANWMYNSFLRNDAIDTYINNGNFGKDKNQHTELLLLYTMALHHPAFTFAQKQYCGDIASRLTEPEIPLHTISQQQPPPCPPGLGYIKPPLPMHHIPIAVGKIPHTSGHGHIEAAALAPLPPPGIPLPAVHGSGVGVGVGVGGIWQRTHFISTTCPDVGGFSLSPLVSQHSSPTHSRSVSPTRIYPPTIPTHKDPLPLTHYNTDLKTVPIDEASESGEVSEKSEWLEAMVLSPKLPNGLIATKCESVLLAGDIQSLNLDGAESTLRCSSSSNSSNSSDCQSPPGTPAHTLHRFNGPANVPPPGLTGGGAGEMTAMYNVAAAAAAAAATVNNQSCSVPYSSGGYPPAMPPPPAPAAAPPFHNSLPPPKLTCYNCGLVGHGGADCKDPNIEEITQKKGYQLDYTTVPPPDVPSSQDKQ